MSDTTQNASPGEELSSLYQEVILEHAQNPRHKGALEAPCRSVEGVNPLCGDHARLYVRLKEGRVEKITFEGDGCAISQACASMVCLELEGLLKEEALTLLERARQCALTGAREGLKDSRLAAFSGVSAFPMRVKCATLALHVAKKAIEAREDGDGGYIEP